MSNFFSYGIFLALTLGLLFPGGENLKEYLSILLVVVLFFNFLDLDFNYKNFIKKELVYYFIFVLLIMPAVVFVVTKEMDINLRIGIMLATIAPTAIGAPVVVKLIKGHSELVLSNLIIYNLLSPLTYTLILGLYFKNSISIPILSILFKIFNMIIVPLICAFIVTRFTKIKHFLFKISSFVNSIALIIIVGIACASASSRLYEFEYVIIIKIFVYILLIASILFIAGYMFSDHHPTKKTLAVMFGHKNSALTIWVALTNFSPITAVPMLLYIVCHHTINGVLINKFAKNNT